MLECGQQASISRILGLFALAPGFSIDYKWCYISCLFAYLHLLVATLLDAAWIRTWVCFTSVH